MRYVVGIDEVGRGPLAGPITVGVVCMAASFSWKHFPKLKDSKKLSEAARNEWYEFIRTHTKIHAAVASVSAKTIDRIGIVAAGNLAARRALAQLNIKSTECIVQLDRGLVVGKEWQQESYIKGDERFPAIALASIYAKVTRDAYMTRIAKRYPRYGFEVHKGYGTRMHRTAILVHGLSTLHRKTFCKRVIH
jgi:ribonuclease HII